jgi:hypothetical protein
MQQPDLSACARAAFLFLPKTFAAFEEFRHERQRNSHLIADSTVSSNKLLTYCWQRISTWFRRRHRSHAKRDSSAWCRRWHDFYIMQTSSMRIVQRFAGSGRVHFKFPPLSLSIIENENFITSWHVMFSAFSVTLCELASIISQHVA